MKKIIQIRQRTSLLHLTWVLNNICTNHCDYCPPNLHMGKNHHYEWAHAKSFIERLMNRFEKIHCAISGGEPTLSPFFEEMIKLFHSKGHYVGITSNAARSVRFWEENSKYLNYICFSYHPSFEDSKFLEKAIMASKYTKVIVRVMMDSRHWDNSIDMYNKCLDIPSIGVEPVRILTEMSGAEGVGNSYTPEQIKWLETAKYKYDIVPVIPSENPSWIQSEYSSEYYYDDGTVTKIGNSTELKNKNLTDFSGWVCNAGLESLFVHYDGVVRRANCWEGGPLFHIDDHSKHSLPENAVICFQNTCHCGTDINLTKVKVFEPDDSYIQDNLKRRIVIREIPKK